LSSAYATPEGEEVAGANNGELKSERRAKSKDMLAPPISGPVLETERL
jgi:hypothetical protein